jgi:transaldolase/glucose-6-phosphate isomerase
VVGPQYPPVAFAVATAPGPRCLGLAPGYDDPVREARWVSGDLGDLEGAVDERLSRLKEVVPRIWARDHTVWRDDPTEITDRLGWLDAPERARGHVDAWGTFAQEVGGRGFTHAVLLGMGGSSLAPEVFRFVFGVAPDALDLRILDSTHPDAIAAVERDVPLDRALFVASSKSGTTIETRSHMDHFLELTGDPSRFVAITDPGSPLERAAHERGFLRVFSSPPDVGGRYSALTEFGLVPAALIGADLDGLLDHASAAVEACGPDVPVMENPGAVLGAILGEAALAGRDKCTTTVDGTLSDTVEDARPPLQLGAWIDQLLAESTGKEGKGILPVDLEPQGSPRVYGDDRLFLALEVTPDLAPYVTLRGEQPQQLGRSMFDLEFATAVSGHVLGIHPFDQPDVQSAKDRTAELLRSMEIPQERERDPGELLASVRPGDYVAIQAFVAPSDETGRELQAVRARIRDRFRVATTLGYGPRYLHSTGQFHKGGPGTGVFIQVFDEPKEDRPIPGREFTFGRLIAAQAAGDLAALRERGRRAARVPREALLAWNG